MEAQREDKSLSKEGVATMKNLVILAYYFEINAITCGSIVRNPYKEAILAQRNGREKWERIECAVEVHFYRLNEEA